MLCTHDCVLHVFECVVCVHACLCIDACVSVYLCQSTIINVLLVVTG